MYVDNEVSQVHSFENKNLARLTLNGQSCERTKGTYAKVPKWTKITRGATISKAKKITVGLLGKNVDMGRRRRRVVIGNA